MFQAPKKKRSKRKKICINGRGGCKVKDVACLVELAKYMTPISLLRLPYYSNCTAPFDAKAGQWQGHGLGNGSRHKDGWCMLRFQFGAAGHLFFGDGAPISSQLSVTCLGSQRTRNRFTGANSAPSGHRGRHGGCWGGATAIERLPFVFAPQPAGFSPRLTPFYYFAVAVVWS